MVEIKKYKAKINETDIEIVGFIIPIRKQIKPSVYNGEIEYIMYVNDFSMPNSEIRGGFKVEEKSIEEYKEQTNELIKDEKI